MFRVTHSFTLLFVSGIALGQSFDPKPIYKTSDLCQNAISSGFQVSADGHIYNKSDISRLADISPILPELKRLRLAFKSNGIDIIPIVIPLRGMLPESMPVNEGDYEARQKDYSDFITLYRKLGFTLPDVLEYTKGIQLWRPFFIHGDHHITQYGASIISASLDLTLKSLKSYQDIPEADFITTRMPDKIISPDHQSRSIQSLDWLCNEKAKIHDDTMDEFETSETSQVGLLDDITQPAIALFGTSQSGPDYNLRGFIKQISSRDVLDGGHIGAGGAYLSMQEYLLSPEYQIQKPKIVIWEFALEEVQEKREGDVPQFTDQQIYKQLIPSIYGECEAKSFSSSGSRLELETNPKPNSYSYVVINYADLSKKDIAITANLSNGKMYVDNVHQSNKIVSRGRIFVELPAMLDYSKKIEINMPGNVKGFTAKICQI